MKKLELLIEQGLVKKSALPVQTCFCCGRKHYYLSENSPLWLKVGSGGKGGRSAKYVSYCKRCAKGLFPTLFRRRTKKRVHKKRSFKSCEVFGG